jgi:exoribonuclease R
MEMGKSGEYLVEQGIIDTYYKKEYFTNWIKPPNPEGEKEEGAEEAVAYLKGKFQVKPNG